MIHTPFEFFLYSVRLSEQELILWKQAPVLFAVSRLETLWRLVPGSLNFRAAHIAVLAFHDCQKENRSRCAHYSL